MGKQVVQETQHRSLSSARPPEKDYTPHKASGRALPPPRGLHLRVSPLGAMWRILRRPVEIYAAPGPLASCLSDEETWRQRRQRLEPAGVDSRQLRRRRGAAGEAGRGPVTSCCSCGRASSPVGAWSGRCRYEAGPEGRGGAGQAGAGQGPGERPFQAAAGPARSPLAGRGAVPCASRTLSAALGRWAEAAWEACRSGPSRVGLPGVLMARRSPGPSF